MPYSRTHRAPKLEPELLQRAAGPGSIAGGMAEAQDGGRVAGATASGPYAVDPDASTTITLCDGSRFTFTRLADLRTTADA